MIDTGLSLPPEARLQLSHPANPDYQRVAHIFDSSVNFGHVLNALGQTHQRVLDVLDTPAHGSPATVDQVRAYISGFLVRENATWTLENLAQIPAAINSAPPIFHATLRFTANSPT